MQAVNLLPRDLAAADRSRMHLPILGAALVPVIALALVLHGYGSARGQVDSAINELSILNTQVAEIAPGRVRAAQEQAAANAATNQLASERTVRLTSLEAALATAPPLDTFLGQISRLLPSGVWLTTLSTSETSTPTFSIGGYGRTNADVADMLARLQLLPALSDITLTGIAVTQVGTTKVVQFTISATPVPPVPVGAAAPTTTTPTTTTPAP